MEETAAPDPSPPSSPFFDPSVYYSADLALDDLGIDADFSIDDLLDFPDDQDLLSLDAPPCSAAATATAVAVVGSPAPPSPDSAQSSSSVVTAAAEAKPEEGSVGSKRKKGGGGGGEDEEEEEEEKRRARLIRNRESAQLSRQRKKHYVEELEEKVRAMHATISNLHSRISLVLTQNAALRQQLASGSAVAAPPPPPGVYPVGPVWVPCPGYALRPNGTQVPLVPIPKLKPQQPAPALKPNKSDSKKAGRKTKKAASISLLGLFFILLVSGVNLKYGRGDGGDSSSGRSRGRVLSVSGRSSQLNGTDDIGLCNGKLGFENGGFDPVTGKRCQTGPWPSPGSDGSKVNSSEPLPALLYVPRNGRHVKINGNLIIHSVLASERATADASSRAESGDPKHTSEKEVRKNGLAVHGNVASALAVPNARRDQDGSSNVNRSSSEDTHGESYKSAAPSEGPLQQWFREGLAGPILSSGMCSEVFQFDVSPASSSPSGIVPATSIINTTIVNSTSDKLPHPIKVKNRRILYPRPIPLPGSTLNNTDHFAEPSSDGHSLHGNKASSSMVVSVLADPREAGDGDGYGMMSSPKSLSRIFVVVLLDSVKYVTYSCVLPLKSSSPHLVN